jgi:two-component system cell cycle response regulator
MAGSDDPQGLRSKRPDQTIRIEGDEVARYASGPKRHGSLLVIAGDVADIGTHLVVERRVVVGRDPGDAQPGADGEIPLKLCDGRSSRRHAAVDPRDGGYVLRDLGSTNGTLLQGEPVSGERPLRDGDKVTIGRSLIKFTLVDDTEAAYLERIERLAGTDELTGLLAKHRFDALLSDAVRNAHANHIALSVLMMDMDGLKAINDRHGHHMGAHTISEVGRMLGEIVTGRGEACRFGGDEFCAFLPGLVLDRAKLVGERIRQAVEDTTFTHSQSSTRATLSVGLAVLTDDILTGEQLLQRADLALYRAKAKGRNLVSS